jgi:hypothetical protein
MVNPSKETINLILGELLTHPTESISMRELVRRINRWGK